MRALNEPKTAKFEEIGAVCVFKSNAPGLKLNFFEPYVDMPSGDWTIQSVRKPQIWAKSGCRDKRTAHTLR